MASIFADFDPCDLTQDLFALTVFLSSRVVVMSARPGRIMHIVGVDLPASRSPQTRTETRYFELVNEVREWLRRAEEYAP